MEHVVGAWTAPLGAIATDHRSLAQLVALLLRRGEHHGVFCLCSLDQVPVSLDQMLGDIEQASSFADVGPCLARLTLSETVASTYLAHYDRNDQFQVSCTTDLGALLAGSIGDALFPQTFPRTYRQAEAPLSCFFSGIDSRGELNNHLEPFALNVQCKSDIWFPWAWAMAYDLDDPHPFVVDNIRLAREHTTRLNAFFAEIREFLSSRGCQFKVDIDELQGRQIPYLKDWGIDLSVKPNERVVAPETLEGNWWTHPSELAWRIEEM